MTETIIVDHNNQTIGVPKRFDRSDLAAWFGEIPDKWDVDRIFEYEDTIRTESYQGNGEWIETIYHTDENHPTFNAQNDRGWIAETVNSGREPDDRIDDPGETLWKRIGTQTIF